MNRRRPASHWKRDDDPLAVFMRGATVGAFVGAVIAGSTIWRRIRRRRARAPARVVLARPGPAASHADETDPRRG